MWNESYTSASLEYILKMIGREKVVKEDKEEYILYNSVNRRASALRKNMCSFEDYLKCKQTENMKTLSQSSIWIIEDPSSFNEM